DAMHQAVRISRETKPLIKDRQVDRLLADLEENIIAVKNAIAILDNQLRDSQQQDAVHTIRSHIGKMQDKIGDYRRLGR
ncbi:MAG: hypothetical protein KDB05_12270, partial [Planctomycetales bacterium]|nr:hypothetical protein [Planctomycetales bacterium]